GIAFAILAAALYAINAPFSKILLEFMPPTLMAGFFFVCGGRGRLFFCLFRVIREKERKKDTNKKKKITYHL
ncbi:EamA family transporter, partial [Anaerobutyricum soehngenii]|uniref:EamA family transporter n=1 Tax=Anaerobutyricum soehngenii TaxID=105843 RepID=UPI001FD7F210